MPFIAMFDNLIEADISADAGINSDIPTTNLSAQAELVIGYSVSFATESKAWIKPDFSLLPSGRTFISSKLKLVITNQTFVSIASMLYAYRCLRAVNNTLVTWNKFSASNWGTAGAGNSTTDYAGAVLLGSVATSATPSIGDIVEIDLDPAEFQKLYDGTYTNNGLIVFTDQDDCSLTYYGSRENTTPSNRPTLMIEYA